jgi:non-specific serine/threonine protein kinase
MELGIEQVRAGAPLDGLLLLRPPARDWLLRGDARVWSVLHGMAIGFAKTGDVDLAARLAGAIGDRPLPFVGPQRRGTLGTLLHGAIDDSARERFERAGRGLSAGAAVSEAIERIDALASRRAADDVGAAPGAEGLTSRQHEVAELVARGLTNKQIAQRLGISRYTAETHVRNILERLGAASRSEIASWVARQPSPP